MSRCHLRRRLGFRFTPKRFCGCELRCKIPMVRVCPHSPHLLALLHKRRRDIPARKLIESTGYSELQLRLISSASVHPERIWVSQIHPAPAGRDQASQTRCSKLHASIGCALAAPFARQWRPPGSTLRGALSSA